MLDNESDAMDAIWLAAIAVLWVVAAEVAWWLYRSAAPAGERA
ncbi:hypothetical protein [Acidovorax sp. FG27]